MKKTFLLGLTLLLMHNVNAQIKGSTLENIYEQKTIYLEESNGKHVKNNEKKKIGLFGRKLKKEFESSSVEAKEEIKQYEKLSKRQTILLTTAGVVLIAAVIAIPPLSIAAPAIVMPIYYSCIGVGLTADTIGIIQSKK